MFAVNEILAFGPGRRQEALDRLSWIHGLMTGHAGFKHAMVAKYLGDATRHTIMRFWEDEEAFRAFRATPDGSYGRSRPEGLYDTVRVITPLVSIGEATGSEASGNFLVKVQREVPEGAWDGFLAQQKGMIAAAPRLPGLVWVRQFRAKDENQALVVARFNSRKAFEDMVESAPYLEMMGKLPEGVSLVRTECFEVVSDVFP